MINPSDDDKRHSFKENAEEILKQTKERIKVVKEKTQQSLKDEANVTTYAALAYLPVIGPLIVYIFKRNQRVSVENALNASYIQGAYVSIWFFVWLLENIPVVSTLLKVILFIPNITNAISYLNVVTLLTFSIYGAIEGSQGRIFRTPYLFDLFDSTILKHPPRNQA